MPTKFRISFENYCGDFYSFTTETKVQYAEGTFNYPFDENLKDLIIEFLQSKNCLESFRINPPIIIKIERKTI